MKSNHNIDKLFAQKLASLEDAPSENAWQTIQKGLVQKKKKKAFWLPYVAAAAVALLIISTVWMRKQVETSGIVIVQNPVKRNKVEQIIVPIQPEKITQKQSDNRYIAEKPTQKQETIVQLEQPSTKENSVVKKTLKATPSQQKQLNPEATELPLPILEEKLATLVPVQETIPVTTLSQSNTIVVTVALSEAEDNPGIEVEQVAEKQTKAGKLLGKLKQLKRGEFDELGIRKETLVAFVKDKTHNSKSHSDNQE